MHIMLACKFSDCPEDCLDCPEVNVEHRQSSSKFFRDLLANCTISLCFWMVMSNMIILCIDGACHNVPYACFADKFSETSKLKTAGGEQAPLNNSENKLIIKFAKKQVTVSDQSG